MLKAITSPRYGVTDRAAKDAATTTPTTATNRSNSAGSFRSSRLAIGMPATSPRIWNGSVAAAANPRWAEFSPNSCS